MKVLFNPAENEIHLVKEGVDIIVPANSEFKLTDEDAEFVMNTLGFVSFVSSAKDEVVVSVPDPKEVLAENKKEDKKKDKKSK